ncbi:hypothetical protein TNCV_364791 [Trichonephila clavipes]|nr:hypothetical protein TNCV_364791 [Trichonephila clavipes]
MVRTQDPISASNVQEIDHSGRRGLIIWEGITLNDRKSFHVFARGTVIARATSQLSAKQKTLKTHHPDEEHKPRLPDSIAQPITNMPLSRIENITFAMPSIIDSHDMGLRTVFSPDAQKKTPIHAKITPPSTLKCTQSSNHHHRGKQLYVFYLKHPITSI